MMRPIVYLSAISFLLMQMSCAPTYLPNALNAPLFQEKGEVEVKISTGTNQLDAQAAVAITNHLAIMGNLARADFEDISDGEFSRHQLAELAFGAFFPVLDHASFEVYGGYGWGKGDSKDEGLISNNSTFITANGDYNRFFLQTNFGINTQFVEGGIGLRASQVDFSSYTENGTVFTNPPSGFFLEPALFVRLGGGQNKWNIKGFMQAGLSIVTAETLEFDHQGLIVNLGVSFRLNRLYQE